MNIGKSYFRTVLLKGIMDRKYSSDVRHEIMLLIGSMNEDSLKEEAARMAIPLFEQSKTEEETLEKIRELVEQIR